MVLAALQKWRVPDDAREAHLGALIGFLRNTVLAPPAIRERGHAVFVDDRRFPLGDAEFGVGSGSELSLRMRDIFEDALRLRARGIVLAHNHPSGDCRPSGFDIAATRRLCEVACALDIVLIDHLIFTHQAVYSMRAGGLL